MRIPIKSENMCDQFGVIHDYFFLTIRKQKFKVQNAIFEWFEQKVYLLLKMSKAWTDVVSLGGLQLKNRIVMSALTRIRCTEDGVPTDLVREYYTQRTGAGLILTECVAVSKRGIGYPYQGCLYSKEQAEAWKKVVDSVRSKGTKMFVQIYHAGRVTHPHLNGGFDPVAPSPIRTREKIPFLPGVEYPVPKQATLEDIQTVKDEFQNSFSLAKQAGFDGIELHGANGYILDTFLRSFSNTRTDHYGGSAENRARLFLEITDLALKYFQPSQIGCKFSPVSRIQDMFDENPIETYGYLLKELQHRKIGFVELTESAHEHSYGARVNHILPQEQIPNVCQAFRPFFGGLIIGNYGFNAQTGIQAIQDGNCDLISFGRNYISHPDLAERIINGIELTNKLDFSTLYWDTKREKSVGYTDYPYYKQE